MSVDSEEWLSRFILHKNHFRQDGTLKADPFIPHPYSDLSVTRHLTLTEQEIWTVGENVADQRQKTLYGRGVNQALCYEDQNLAVTSAPVEGNQNHANVVGWPTSKPEQKIIALEIAANSQYVAK